MGLAKTAARLVAAEILYGVSAGLKFAAGIVSGALTRGADRLYGVAALKPVEEGDIQVYEDEAGEVVTRAAAELFAVPDIAPKTVLPPPLEGSIEHRRLGQARRRGGN